MKRLYAWVKNHYELIGYAILIILLFCACFNKVVAWSAAIYILFFAFLMDKEVRIMGLILFVSCFYIIFNVDCIAIPKGEFFRMISLFELILNLLKLLIILLYFLRIIRKERKLNLAVFLPIVCFLIYMISPLHACDWEEWVPLALSFISFYVIFEVRSEINFLYTTRIFIVGLVFSGVFYLLRDLSPFINDRLIFNIVGGLLRFQGFTVHSLQYAAFSMLAICALLILKLKNKVNLFEFYLLLISTLIFGYLTLSRAFIFTVAVALIIFAIFYLVQYKTKALPLLVSLLVVVGIVAVIFLDQTKVYLGRLIEPYYDASYGWIEKSVESSNSIITAGENSDNWFQKILDNIFRDTERVGLLKLYLEDWLSSPFTIMFGRGISYRNVYYDAHNLFIQRLWEHGLVGYVFYILIFISLINWKKIKHSEKYTAVLVLFIPWVLFSLVELQNFNYIAFMLMIAAIGLIGQTSEKRNEIQTVNVMPIHSGEIAQQIGQNSTSNFDLLKEIKLSIIIPVYKGEKYIQATIDKVLQIDLKKEIIVVNDASPDNALSILKRYNDKIILIDLKENHGVAYARNCGLKKATGDYITFMDQDDDFELDMHSKILTKMLQTGSDVGMCNYNIVEENGKTEISKYNLALGDLPQDEVIRLHLRDKIIPLIWTSIYHAPLAKKNSFKKINLGEDVLYQLQIILNAQKTCFVDEVLYHYMQHQSSAMHSVALNNTLMERLKIPDSLTVDEKQMLNDQFYEEFEYFRLLTIYRGVHGVSATAWKDMKSAKQLLKKILNKEICQKIIKNKYTPWCIKFEFIILKTFGISFHLFFFQFYRFLRRIFMPGGIQ